VIRVHYKNLNRNARAPVLRDVDAQIQQPQQKRVIGRTHGGERGDNVGGGSLGGARCAERKDQEARVHKWENKKSDRR
jgi:hypothetical protein